MSDTSIFQKYRLIACISISLAAGLCSAQTVAVDRNTLTNRSIVTLAKAGFDEDFIVDTILSSRTRFDTSVDGLADLAKQGMTERLIRVMMNPAVEVSPAGVGGVPGSTTSPGMPPPYPEHPERPNIVPPSAEKVAVATQTPYYKSTSIFFGIFKTRAGVGTPPATLIPPAALHLGMLHENVRLPHAYLPIGGLPQYYHAVVGAPGYMVQVQQ